MSSLNLDGNINFDCIISSALRRAAYIRQETLLTLALALRHCERLRENQGGFPNLTAKGRQTKINGPMILDLTRL